MAKGKEKIDIVLEKIDLLEKGQQSNYDLIQKQGIMLEQVASDVKLVAEGHVTIRREMQEMKNELKEDIKLVDDKLDFAAKQLGNKIDKIDQKLDEHVRQPAHAML